MNLTTTLFRPRRYTIRHAMLLIFVVSLALGIEEGVRRRAFFQNRLEIHIISENSARIIASNWENTNEKCIERMTAINAKLFVEKNSNARAKLESSLSRWTSRAEKTEAARRLNLVNAEYHRQMIEKYKKHSNYLFLSYPEDDPEPDIVIDLDQIPNEKTIKPQ